MSMTNMTKIQKSIFHSFKNSITKTLLLMPPGAMSLKIQGFFSLAVENVGSHDVFFCREQIQQRDAGDVLLQNSSKSNSFSCGSDFC